MNTTIQTLLLRSPTFAAWYPAVRDTTGCWEWTGGYFSCGYARISVNREGRYLSRVMYEGFKGPIPEGLVVDHLCRNPRCANPDHLEAVTQRVNTLRGIGPASLNAAKTQCPKGHPYTEENTYRFADKRRRNCRTCRIEQAKAANKKNQAKYSAIHAHRYRTDPEYRARKIAIQRACAERKRKAS